MSTTIRIISPYYHHTFPHQYVYTLVTDLCRCGLAASYRRYPHLLHRFRPFTHYLLHTHFRHTGGPTRLTHGGAGAPPSVATFMVHGAWALGPSLSSPHTTLLGLAGTPHLHVGRVDPSGISLIWCRLYLTTPLSTRSPLSIFAAGGAAWHGGGRRLLHTTSHTSAVSSHSLLRFHLSHLSTHIVGGHLHSTFATHWESLSLHSLAWPFPHCTCVFSGPRRPSLDHSLSLSLSHPRIYDTHHCSTYTLCWTHTHILGGHTAAHTPHCLAPLLLAPLWATHTHTTGCGGL